MKNLKVTGKDEGQRLDRFLAEKMQVSRKKAKQWIDQGQIFLGKKKLIIASWELQGGDEIQIQEPGAAVPSRRRRYLKVYYQDKDLIVVEKPAGVACESTPQTLTSTLVDDLNDYLRRSQPDHPYPYLGLMHRLDRETSGLMVYTLSRRGNRLAQDFRAHRIARRYLALVEGSLSRSQGRIELSLQKDPASGGKRMKVRPAQGEIKGHQGRAKPGRGVSSRAITDYLVQERYPGATLVEARLLTGKTHQVRVHLASVGHPVVGDALYGQRGKAPRQLLHSAYLEFRHPVTGKKMIFRSPLPKDFRAVLEKVRKRELGL